MAVLHPKFKHDKSWQSLHSNLTTLHKSHVTPLLMITYSHLSKPINSTSQITHHITTNLDLCLLAKQIFKPIVLVQLSASII